MDAPDLKYSTSVISTKCRKLTTIYISDKWKTNSIVYSGDMFNGCCSLTGFSPERTNVKMAKPVEQGGYLTLKK